MEGFLMRTAKKVALLLILSFAFIVMPFSMMAGEDEKVYAADSDEISLSKTSITLAPATYKQLTLNGTSKTVKWTTSNNSVAIVTSAGKVYAKKKGTATITAKIKVDGTWQKYTCKVKVKYQTKTVGDITYKDASGTYSVSGKWYKRNFSGKKYQFTNASGSAIYFKTTGTKKVTIEFAYTTTIQKPKIGYSIDGKSFKYKTVGSSVTLNLGNAKTHYVRIVLDRVNPYEDRWSGNGGIAIKSIKPVTASTGVVTAVKPQNPVVVFYG
ncbi:MAG: Ig-like domain-containing protein, partial [Lachnospiraceae bacterium]|nr:Ig-like domain-containing protein [Lachnospiraceae bacterium]